MKVTPGVKFDRFYYKWIRRGLEECNPHFPVPRSELKLTYHCVYKASNRMEAHENKKEKAYTISPCGNTPERALEGPPPQI